MDHIVSVAVLYCQQQLVDVHSHTLRVQSVLPLLQDFQQILFQVFEHQIQSVFSVIIISHDFKFELTF